MFRPASGDAKKSPTTRETRPAGKAARIAARSQGVCRVPSLRLSRLFCPPIAALDRAGSKLHTASFSPRWGWVFMPPLFRRNYSAKLTIPHRGAGLRTSPGRRWRVPGRGSIQRGA